MPVVKLTTEYYNYFIKRKVRWKTTTTILRSVALGPVWSCVAALTLGFYSTISSLN